MQIGVVFPQTEIGADAGAIKEYAQGVEAMGYRHVLAYDHVLGADTTNRPGWRGSYGLEDMFHEPLMLFSWMAGITEKLSFFTGILILPQRQTALVAKQAACLDVLSGGRLRLGFGIGWNQVEYEALGMNFHDRGKRCEEQIEVLRALWTKRTVNLELAHHRIAEAGLNPLPVQRPIPLWIGGGSDRQAWDSPASDIVIRRIARLADGWLPLWEPGDRARELLAKCHAYCREYGRDPRSLGLEGRLNAKRATEARWSEGIEAWRDLGSTHLSINTMGDGLSGAEQHLRRLEEFSPLLADDRSQAI